MQKQMVSLILLAALIITVFAGCASQNDANKSGQESLSDTSGTSQSVGNPDAATQEDREIVVCAGPGSPITSGNFDPLQGFLVQGFYLFHSSLLKINSDLEMENDLAVGDYTISDDKLVYTFQIREDAYFSDGTQLQASDVAFTFNKMKDAGTDVDVSNMDYAEAVDPFTVRFVLREPQSTFIDQCALIGIVPEASYDGTYAAKGIGSGPWQLVQCDIDQQTIVEPNPYYYGETPYFEKVTFVNLDEKAALAALQTGDVDVCDISSEYALEEIDGMHLVTVDTVDTRVITLPTVPETVLEDGTVIGNDVTSDLAIRQALNIGLERQQIIDDAYNGIGLPGYGWATSWGTGETFTDGQVAEAQKLLEDAGWIDTDNDGIREKDGVRAEFDVYAFSFQMERYNLAVAAAAQAAENLGIQINCIADSSDVIRANRMSSGVVYGFGEYTAQQIKGWYYTGMPMNVASYSNLAVDQAIDAAVLSTTAEEALEHWQDAQDIAAADVPYLYLVNIKHCLFVRDGLDLGEVVPNPHGHGAPIIGNMSQWHWE